MTDGIHEKCGHAMKPILYCDNPVCFADYIVYLNFKDEHGDYCYDCFKKLSNTPGSCLAESGCKPAVR